MLVIAFCQVPGILMSMQRILIAGRVLEIALPVVIVVRRRGERSSC